MDWNLPLLFDASDKLPRLAYPLHPHPPKKGVVNMAITINWKKRPHSISSYRFSSIARHSHLSIFARDALKTTQHITKSQFSINDMHTHTHTHVHTHTHTHRDGYSSKNNRHTHTHTEVATAIKTTHTHTYTPPHTHTHTKRWLYQQPCHT